MARQPPVTWAQRESFVFITIEVDEAKIEDLKIEGNKLHFQGTSKTDKYEATLELFDEVKGDEVKRAESNTRVIELSLAKKEAKWWPRLLKDKGKAHWLRVDFDKWVDEDESGAEEGAPQGMGDFDLSQYMGQMGGGMPGAGGMPPGMAGMMGGAGAGADFDGLDDDSDGEMPELEDNEEEAQK